MTTPDPGFARPAGQGDKFDNHEHTGRLLIIYPKAYDPNTTTSKGVNACADADIIVVDSLGPDGKPLVFHDAKIFGNLAKSVRNDVGGKVLGRLGQVPTASGNLAWVLNDYTDADVALAVPADAAYKAGQFAPPAQQAATPPPADVWAGTNAAPAPPPAPQYAATPAAAAPVAPPAAAPAPTADPLVAQLIGAGIPADKVLAMDAATRQAVAATL